LTQPGQGYWRPKGRESSIEEVGVMVRRVVLAAVAVCLSVSVLGGTAVGASRGVTGTSVTRAGRRVAEASVTRADRGVAGASVTRAGRDQAGASVTGGQTLRQAWVSGGDTTWAWTEDLNGAPQGLERTVDAGRSWADVTPPGLSKQTGNHVISGFYALGAQHAWVEYGAITNGAAQKIAATTDGGKRWKVVGDEPLTSVSYSGYVYQCGLDFVTASDGWCEALAPFVGSEGVYLYRTTDGGARWHLISRTGPQGNPKGSLPFGGDKEMQFSSPEQGWAIFSSPRTAPLYETSDGGRTWVSRKVATAPGNPDGGSGFTGVPVLSGARGAVGYTISGQPLKTVVYVSTDHGAAWHPVTPPGQPEGWVADTITPLSWRLVAGDRVLSTDNGGRAWRTITSNVTFHLYYAYDDPTPPVVDFVTGQVGWIAGTSLWRTTDGGHRWAQLTVPGT
jgi:hypothetical protein